MVKPDGILKHTCYCIDCMHNSRSNFKEENPWGLCVLDEIVITKRRECGSYESDAWFIFNCRKEVKGVDGSTSFVWAKRLG